MSFLKTLIGLSVLCFVAAIPSQVPTKETCAQKPNEMLQNFESDVPCYNTCESYKVPCNVMVIWHMSWSPHCVCKEGYSRLPTGECVPFDDPECEALWKPSEEQCTFRGNEVYRWGSACQKTCDEVVSGKTKMCTEQLVEGCYCPEGMVRYVEDGQCVSSEKCPLDWD